MKYIRVRPDQGIEVIEAEAIPSLHRLQQSNMCAYSRFSDPRITIVQTQKGLAKPLTAIGPKGEALHGELFIIGLRNIISRIEFVGLTDEQIGIVQTELKLN